MTRTWRCFLLIRFPLAMVALGVVCQLVAMSLAHLPLRRNRLDELALAVRNDHQAHRIVLLGDSIIRDTTLEYAAGTSAEVVNLATQRIVGLPGGMLLLRRYLQNHQPPQYVVVAAAPDDYNMVSGPEWLHYYLWNTFADADERAFLKSHMPDIDARESYPASMDLQDRIVERLFTLLKHGSAHFDAPPPAPDPNAPVEPITDNQADPQEEAKRVASNDLSLAPLNAAFIGGMCQLSRQYGFELNMVWTPMPPTVLKDRIASGQLAGLENQLKAIFRTNGCAAGSFFDMNAVQTFTNFDVGSLHVRGSGWAQRTASVLNRYLHNLPDRSGTEPSAPRAAEQATASRGLFDGL